MQDVDRERGSSLVEALVAALILTTGVATMAQLFSAATASNLAARRSTVATILAEQKLEQLRALTWAYDPAGLPVADLSTDTTATPESSSGTGLQASPPAALQQNTAGFVDHVGGDGGVVGRGAQAPPQAVYTRRWSIERVSTTAESALVIQVLVTAPGSGVPAGSGQRVRGEARIVTVKARKAQ